MYLGQNFHLWVYFSSAPCVKISKTCRQPEANSVAWHCTRTALANPKYQPPVTASSRTDLEHLADSWFKIQLLSCSKWSSPCEKISQTCGELRGWYHGGCFYAKVLPTEEKNSSPHLRILENRRFTDGVIIISRISPLFSAPSFLKISITWSEPRSR